MFRGDECVSLGWCFWHRGCYGCLMCGDRRVVEGKTVGELFAGHNNVHVDGGKGMGKEIDQVPLCRRCVEEMQTERERLSEERLVPLALARIDRFDGGLSRRRWEAQQDAETAVPSYPRQHGIGDPEDARRAPSPIYVDIHDPIGGPAFKRRPTKPIPEWMQYLPSARRDQDEPRAPSLLDSHFTSNGADTFSSDDDDDDTTPPPVPPHRIPVVAPPPVPPHTINKFDKATVPTYTPVKMSRPFTLITEEPVQRPSSARMLGAGAGAKHVRFDGVSSHAGPSTSAEYLERYSVGRPEDVKSGLTVGVLSGVEGSCSSRGDGLWSPPALRRECGGSSAATTRMIRAGGVGGCNGTGTGAREYSASPGSSLYGVEGVGGGKRSRALGMTFQDQLKRVFGFN